VAPVATITALPPGQIDAEEGVRDMLGGVLNITVTVPGPVTQPRELVPVTEYVVLTVGQTTVLNPG